MLSHPNELEIGGRTHRFCLHSKDSPMAASWLPRLVHRLVRTSQRRRHGMARPLAAGFRPLLEALEDRTLLSTLTVLNNFDSGPGSLRATIANANSGDSIVFDASLNHQTITLTSGDLFFTKN